MDILNSGAGLSQVVVPHGLADGGCNVVRADRRDHSAGNRQTRRDVATGALVPVIGRDAAITSLLDVVTVAGVCAAGRDMAPPVLGHGPRVVGGKG